MQSARVHLSSYRGIVSLVIEDALKKWFDHGCTTNIHSNTFHNNKELLRES